MKLCTFQVVDDFGPKERLGLKTPGENILDLNFAYALTLFEKESHPRARAIADAVMPSDMLTYLQNEKHGPKAVDEVLSHLGNRIEDRSLRGIHGECLVRPLENVTLLAPLAEALVHQGHLVLSGSSEKFPARRSGCPPHLSGNPGHLLQRQLRVGPGAGNRYYLAPLYGVA